MIYPSHNFVAGPLFLQREVRCLDSRSESGMTMCCESGMMMCFVSGMRMSYESGMMMCGESRMTMFFVSGCFSEINPKVFLRTLGLGVSS